MKSYAPKVSPILSLTWHYFVGHYQSSDSRVLRWTQFFLFFFLMTLSVTSSSIQHYLSINLQQLLGADIVISQYQNITQEQLQYIAKNTEKISKNVLINVTLSNEDVWQSAQIKGVDEDYPVQGTLLVSSQLGGAEGNLVQGPRVGELWVDARLFSSLNLTMNQPVLVAGKTLTVTQILLHEPDRMLEGHSVAMRAMVNIKDLADTFIAQDTSQYRYLLAATQEQRSVLLPWLKQNLALAQVMHQGGQHPLALFWQRTENFLGLVSVLLFLMAAIAIDQVCRRQAIKQKRFVALCMSMGLSKTKGVLFGVMQWLLGFFVLFLPALLLAFVAQYFLIIGLQEYFPEMSSYWSLSEVLSTTLTLVILLSIFQLPHWLELSNVNVAQLLREQPRQSIVKVRVLFSLTSISLLAALYSDNLQLTMLTLSAMFSTMLFMMVLTWLLLALGEKLSQRFTGLVAFTFFMMKQRLMTKATQILGVGLCLTLLLFTLMLLKDVGQTMQQYTRSYDGNLMITQASDEQMPIVREWAKQSGSSVRQLKPYFKSQLLTINDIALDDFSTQPSESLATLQKPIRMHWSEQVPKNNAVVKGVWWSENDEGWQQISVEEEVMTDMGLEVGDKLTFQIEGKSFEFIIRTAHVYKPGYGSITFWFQIPEQAISHIDARHYFMGSMELPESAWPKLANLWRELPTLRLLSIKEMTKSFDNMLAMITKVVVGFSILICILAILVIIASVQGYQTDEKKKNGLMLSLGQPKSTCLRLALYEWLITGLIAACGAIAGTWFAGDLIYKSQFSMTYSPNIQWLLGTLLIVVTAVCLAGVLSSRNSLKSSVQYLINGD